MSNSDIMRAQFFAGLTVVSIILSSASCSSAPQKSPVKEVHVQSTDTVAQAYAIEDPEIGNAESLTAEPVIEGSSLESGADVLLGNMVNGDPVYLSQFRQKVVLANYWSSDCDPCIPRLREIAQLANDYRSFGLIVANVNMGDAPRAASARLSQMGLDRLSGLQLTDPSGLAAGGVGVVRPPTTLLFDGNGIEVMRYGGDSNIGRIRQDLDLMLK